MSITMALDIIIKPVSAAFIISPLWRLRQICGLLRRLADIFSACARQNFQKAKYGP
jgi:hypothetical protein